MKISLAALGLYLLWKFFHRQKSILGVFSFELANEVADYLVCLLRALFFGYITYLLIAVFGSVGHLESPLQLYAIFTSTPNEVGAAGVLGLIIGFIIAVRAFYGTYALRGERQGRTVVIYPVQRKRPILVRCAFRVFKFIKPN